MRRLLDYIFYFLNSALCICEIVVMFIYWNNSYINYSNWTDICFYLSLVSIILNIALIILKKIKIYDFRLIITLLMYCFMYGRIWLIHIGLQDQLTWSLHKLVPVQSLFRASLFVLCCNQLFFLGLFCGRESIPFKTSCQKSMSHYDLKVIESVGILLLLISIPCRIITDIYTYNTTNATGYYYNYQSMTGLFDDFAFLLVPGILCICESHKKHRLLILGIAFVYFVIIMALTGDRRYYAASILALTIYFVYTIVSGKKVSAKPFRTAVIVALALLFLNFLEVVQKMRNGGLVSLSVFISTYGNDVFALDDLLFDVMAEFGISFFSVASIIEHVPSYLNYQYGLTIIKSIPSILPIGFLNSSLGVVSPSDYINAYTDLPVGGTLFGDLYANFSFLSLLFVFFSGLFIRILMSKICSKKTSLRIVLYFTFSFVLVNLVRCTIFEIVRPVVWCTLIPYIIFLFFNRGVKSNGLQPIRRAN